MRYAERQIVPILPDSPPRFVNLNQYLWSERWLERYQEMDFIQRVLNGMASRRPRLERCATPGRIWIPTMTGWRGSSGAFIRR